MILSAVRTPIGAFLGALKDVPSPKLGAAAIKAAVERAKITPADVEEVVMGCVLQAGLGQAPARQATIFSGLPQSVRATTVHRVCGSGLKAVMLADQAIRCGDSQVMVAGGMESMSRAPFLLEGAREGYRLGHQKVIDSVIQDGLWDVYNNQHMGDCAELCAKDGSYSREEQDRFAAQSYQRAMNSIASGKFEEEIVGVEIITKKGTVVVDTDEEPGKGKIDKFPELRPAFQKAGTVTAANASSLNDGGAALVIANENWAKKKGLVPMARILGQVSFAQAPEWFTTAPVGAVRKLMEVTGFSVEKVDLFEINEAFSVVALACMKELGLSESKVNVRGGSVALGHPIGASGARILITLLHALRAEKKGYGVAAICIGGGEASAVLVENLS